MDSIKVLVEYIPKKEGQSINAFALPSGNNICGDVSSLLAESSGETPFILGASPMGNGDTFWDTTQKYPGFMSDTLTQSDGSTNVGIGIVGRNIDHITINFDKKANQFATLIEVLGKPYKNNGTSFTCILPTTYSNLSISIKSWNKPLYPVRITSIVLGLTVEYDHSQITDLNIGSQILADNSKPAYGVLSQYGNITFLDKDKEVSDLARLRILKANLNVKIYLNKPNRSDYSTEVEYQSVLLESQLGDFMSEKWNYMFDSNRVKIELKDTLMKWNNIIFGGIQWQESKSALDVFNILNSASGNIISIDSSVSTFLDSIKIIAVFLEKSTLLEAWNKLCDLAQLIIYKKNDGNIIAVRCQ